ncbi:MAG TPA: low molecular weight protein-tyrosine-phosphatase [Burkholderiaceae bacterium]|nr:low molecular weight protein-tyrosine-phosphatase [Burkholderiaceae bacterium]
MNPADRSPTLAPCAVLFVCMGNICRSPTAHGVFRHKVNALGLADHITVDSAGTHNYHPGSPPDNRSQAHASLRGYDLSDLRARQVVPEDFDRYDLILVMDHDNQRNVLGVCPPAHHSKVQRLTTYCVRYNSPVVPDPYYGGGQGFEHVLDLIEDACDGLIRHLVERQRG